MQKYEGSDDNEMQKYIDDEREVNVIIFENHNSSIIHIGQKLDAPYVYPITFQSNTKYIKKNLELSQNLLKEYTLIVINIRLLINYAEKIIEFKGKLVFHKFEIHHSMNKANRLWEILQKLQERIYKRDLKREAKNDKPVFKNHADFAAEYKPKILAIDAERKSRLANKESVPAEKEIEKDRQTFEETSPEIEEDKVFLEKSSRPKPKEEEPNWFNKKEKRQETPKEEPKNEKIRHKHCDCCIIS